MHQETKSSSASMQKVSQMMWMEFSHNCSVYLKHLTVCALDTVIIN